IIAKYYLIEIIESEKKDNAISNMQSSTYFKIESVISRIVDNNQDIIKFKRNMKETVLIFKGDTVDDLEESAYSFAQSIKYEVERNTDNLLTIGIGSVRERIQGITESFSDADIAKNYKYVFGKNKIIGIKDIKTDVLSKDELLKLDNLSIISYLKCGVKSNIQEYLSSYIQCLSEPSMKSLIYTYYAFMDIVLTSARFVNELGGDIESLIPEITYLEKILGNMDSISNFKEYAEKILTKVFDFRDSKVENRYGSVINKAKEYINKNYSDPEVSLNSLAAYVNISPSHFSTIFSQGTGDTFIEYLTMARINKAMEFLKTTNHKSSEIAYKVGYNDPHYFSYLFKKVTGLTPKEYRGVRQ
ncbi:MAG: two component transcriptional regulator, AraC family, partial [Clostridiales bacterium]|nr:two component transcriptional regulator, AraC family [Clostridiales bacterium]